MFSWGLGNLGQLGLGGIEETNVGIPSQVKFEGDIEFIAVGSEHSLILSAEGKVFSCGSNDYGQLGHSLTQTRFAMIEGLSQYNIKSIACGGQHSLALDEWGKAFSWGRDTRGQIGRDDENKETPKIIRSLGRLTVVQVAAGLHHSLALTNDGKLYAWGDNSCGQLGLGKEAGDKVSKPQEIESLKGVTPLMIAAGGEHSMMVTMSGTVYSWGKNTYGQLGLGDINNNFFPRQIRMLRSLGVKYIACGNGHSVILTEDGGVFSFGLGRFGQLGHGSFSNEIWPRKIMELMGTEVTQIACGDRHTLAFIPSRGKLYSFGLGGSGQLGRESLSNVNTPQVIYGPWVQPSGQPRRITRQHSSSGNNYYEDNSLTIYSIGAGGNSSFAIVRNASNSSQGIDFRTFYHSRSILTLTPSLMTRVMSISNDQMVDQDLMENLETIFQSLSCMNASFLIEDHSNCSSKKHGIDLDAWLSEVFVPLSICPRESIKNLVYDSLSNKLIPQLHSSPPDVEVLRIYLVLPLYKIFRDNPVLFRDLHFIYAMRFLALEKNPQKVLEKWISSSSQAYFRNLTMIFKLALCESLKFDENKNHQTGSISKISTTFLLLLRILNRINSEKNPCIISEEDFYIPEMSEHFDLQSSYVYWLLNKHQTSTTANHVCNFPFTFDATAKTTLLEVDQGFQMHSAQQRASFQYWFNAGFGDPESFSFLNLEVDRDNLVQTTLSIVHQLSPSDLKKPLRVKFKDEEAEDAGGVKKEFFLLLIREITDPKFGMFKQYDDGVIWFSSSCFEDSDMFTLIGVLCGLAIYNFTIINIPFPLPLYKKLLGVKVGSIEDYACLSPTTAENFQRMLDFTTTEEIEALSLNFTLTENVFGESKVIELKPNGEEIDVTLENKQEYVDLYIDYILNKSVASQYDAFHIGFHKVCGGRVLDLFQAKELMALVVGNENYDWDELEKNALYKNGYTRESETINDFWFVFHGLSLDEKKKFLLFLTGTDRIPILGMKAVSLIIQRTNETEYLPVAHTCFNILDLPDYKSRETLRTKLLISIQCTQGFGLA